MIGKVVSTFLVAFVVVFLVIQPVSAFPNIGIVKTSDSSTEGFPADHKGSRIGIARSDSTNSPSSEPTPELSWTEGTPFPVFSGRTVFPTLGQPVSSPPAYYVHWYAGSVYPSGSPTQNARTIYMNIRVPYSAPMSDEFYYVLLSAWDSAGSYDQIGFSGDYGTWGLTYSWTSGPPSNPTYHYSPKAMALSLGITYTFNITTVSGVTHFVAYQDSTQVWSLDAPTGGNYLVLSNLYSGYYDYTDYEEVWYTHTSGGSPAFDFYFYNNYWVSQTGGSNAAIWSSWHSSGAPGNVAVVISGNSVLVDNPRGTILFKTNPTGFVASAGTITFSGYTYSNSQTGDYADSDYQATANAPTGYQFHHWEYSGSSGSGVYVPNINVNPATVQVSGDGWLKAIFSAQITFCTNPSSAGSIQYGSSLTYTNGQTRWETNLPPEYSNQFSITANVPSGYIFGGWSVTGGLSVASSSSNPTTLTVTGTGALTAIFNSSVAKLYANLVVRGSNNLIYYRTYNVTTSSWTSWNALPGATCDSPAATVTGNELQIVVRGVDGSTLWHGYVNLVGGGFSGWALLSGSSPSAPTLTSNSTHLSLVVRGQNNLIYYRFCTIATRTWTGWNVLPTGSTIDSPAAAMLGNKLHVVVRGLDGYTLWHSSVDLSTSAFSGWMPLSGSTPSAPTLSANSTTLCIAVRGQNNLIYYRFYDIATLTWNGWSALPTGSTIDSPAITLLNDKLQVIVRGLDGNSLWHGSIDLATSAFSGWAQLSGSTPSKPTLTS